MRRKRKNKQRQCSPLFRLLTFDKETLLPQSTYTIITNDLDKREKEVLLPTRLFRLFYLVVLGNIAGIRAAAFVKSHLYAAAAVVRQAQG